MSLIPFLGCVILACLAFVFVPIIVGSVIEWAERGE